MYDLSNAFFYDLVDICDNPGMAWLISKTIENIWAWKSNRNWEAASILSYCTFYIRLKNTKCFQKLNVSHERTSQVLLDSIWAWFEK